jgi:segregation and condensation protein A
MNDFAAAAVDRPPPDDAEPDQLRLDLDGYEGPIDLLLSLARAQKLDLARISILALADQYLAFIAARRRFDLAVAADYLVMAAILAWLKSCLLLPPAATEDEPDAEEIGELLRHRLALLQAMQEAGRRLLARPLCGRDFYFRGAPEPAASAEAAQWQVGFFELVRGYGEIHRRRNAAVLTIAPSAFQSIDAALIRLSRLIGRTANWRLLSSFLPAAAPGAEELRRSALAASFAAVLELALRGRVELRQEQAFGPIWLRRAGAGAALSR